MINNKFPLDLHPTSAQTIINLIEEPTTKYRAASKWGAKIVLGEDIKVSKIFYKHLRKIATYDLNRCLDILFGKDIDFSILNNTDVFYVEWNDQTLLFKGAHPFGDYEKAKIHKIQYFYPKTGEKYEKMYPRIDWLCKKEEVKLLRKATPEEVELFDKKFDIKIEPGQIWRLSVENKNTNLIVTKIERNYSFIRVDGTVYCGWCNLDLKSFKYWIKKHNFQYTGKTLRDFIK